MRCPLVTQTTRSCVRSARWPAWTVPVLIQRRGNPVPRAAQGSPGLACSLAFPRLLSWGIFILPTQTRVPVTYSELALSQDHGSRDLRRGSPVKLTLPRWPPQPCSPRRSSRLPSWNVASWIKQLTSHSPASPRTSASPGRGAAHVPEASLVWGVRASASALRWQRLWRHILFPPAEEEETCPQ